MKKNLIDYIRAKDQCNYTDIYDYFKDLNQCDDKLKAQYLVELIIYISNVEHIENT